MRRISRSTRATTTGPFHPRRGTTDVHVVHAPGILSRRQIPSVHQAAELRGMATGRPRFLPGRRKQDRPGSRPADQAEEGLAEAIARRRARHPSRPCRGRRRRLARGPDVPACRLRTFPAPSAPWPRPSHASITTQTRRLRRQERRQPATLKLPAQRRRTGHCCPTILHRRAAPQSTLGSNGPSRLRCAANAVTATQRRTPGVTRGRTHARCGSKLSASRPILETSCAALIAAARLRVDRRPATARELPQSGPGTPNRLAP